MAEFCGAERRHQAGPCNGPVVRGTPHPGRAAGVRLVMPASMHVSSSCCWLVF